ncbi:MAG: T9SS type A sorting domain-containing protein [Salibacteraceae bacterium]
MLSNCTHALLLLFFGVSFTPVMAQFPGPAGTAGSTAMHKDSAAFIGWADACTVVRGLQEVTDPSLGPTLSGNANNVLGPADGNGIVSLGDGGEATVTFNPTIANGPGFDFAVFENAFDEGFLELAFVEVSSDVVIFFRFPATSNTSDSVQIGPFDNTGDATLIDNLAGKYKANFGTPFDLDDLSGNPGLNIMAVSHMRIIDVVGSIDPSIASFDQFGNAINDPFPTPFPTGGFDLDAVGVVHQGPVSVAENLPQSIIKAYPNPVSQGNFLVLEGVGPEALLDLRDLSGRQVLLAHGSTLNTAEVSAGWYWLQVHQGQRVGLVKIQVLP